VVLLFRNLGLDKFEHPEFTGFQEPLTEDGYSPLGIESILDAQGNERSLLTLEDIHLFLLGGAFRSHNQRQFCAHFF
jgi:hypothetical protein